VLRELRAAQVQLRHREVDAADGEVHLRGARQRRGARRRGKGGGQGASSAAPRPTLRAASCGASTSTHLKSLAAVACSASSQRAVSCVFLHLLLAMDGSSWIGYRTAAARQRPVHRGKRVAHIQAIPGPLRRPMTGCVRPSGVRAWRRRGG
jgi:hypothetical protein